MKIDLFRVLGVVSFLPWDSNNGTFFAILDLLTHNESFDCSQNSFPVPQSLLFGAASHCSNDNLDHKAELQS